MEKRNVGLKSHLFVVKKINKKKKLRLNKNKKTIIVGKQKTKLLFIIKRKKIK